jgi:hypothetical protein
MALTRCPGSDRCVPHPSGAHVPLLWCDSCGQLQRVCVVDNDGQPALRYYAHPANGEPAPRVSGPPTWPVPVTPAPTATRPTVAAGVVP